MKNLMNSYVADELANKVKILSRTIKNANDMITSLEIENKRLKDIFTNLMSINNEDLVLVSEGNDDRLYKIETEQNSYTN